MKKIKPSYLYVFYEGDIEIGLGNKDNAIKLWNEGVNDHPTNWLAHFSRGDRLFKLGQYKNAIKDYEKALEIQEKPRYVDALICIAQINEILGHYDKAIDARDRQIALLKDEYNVVSGETIDSPNREIERLKKLCEVK